MHPPEFGYLQRERKELIRSNVLLKKVKCDMKLFLSGVLTSSVFVAYFSFEESFKVVTLIRAGVDNIFAASISSISESARQFCLLLKFD